jgi:hypothetical protein
MPTLTKEAPFLNHCMQEGSPFPQPLYANNQVSAGASAFKLAAIIQ